MKKINIKKLNETIYYEKLDNGLEIFIYPNNKVDSWYMTFSSKFGSKYKKFKYEGDKEFIELPKGTAHFLEHLTFKTKDGDVSEIFPKYEAGANAYTSTKVTTYEVWGHSHFYENLELLINFVQEPFYNEETVNNEKGIICEEVNMYSDNIDRVISDTINNIVFVNDYRKDKVSGEVEDVMSISLDDIKLAYDYFYNPSNMFISISGPCEPEKVIDFIKNNQSKKQFIKKSEVIVENPIEPDYLNVTETEYKVKVETDCGFYMFKMPLSLFKDYTKKELKLYVRTINNIHFGPTSLLHEKLLNSGLCVSGVHPNIRLTDDHITLSYEVSGDNVDEVLDLIIEELHNLKITSKDIERKRRIALANKVCAFDNIYDVVESINSQIINDGYLEEDPNAIIYNMNEKDANKIISLFNFENDARIKFIKK